MIKAIHQSMVSAAFRCGEQFRRRYIEGEIIPPGVAAGRGTGVHKANEANLKQKIVSGVDLTISDMKDAARDGFVHAFDNGIFLVPDEIPGKARILNDALNECLSLTGLYGAEVAPEITPVDVERKFLIEVGLPLPLAGQIDIEQAAKIDDLKTAGKSWEEGRIEKEIQPFFYSYVYEQETGTRPLFVYHILQAGKKGPKRQIQSVKPQDRHYKALFAKLNIFCDMLKSGVFPPADPAGWICSSRWCGFYQTCNYVGNTKTTWI